MTKLKSKLHQKSRKRSFDSQDLHEDVCMQLSQEEHEN